MDAGDGKLSENLLVENFELQTIRAILRRHFHQEVYFVIYSFCGQVRQIVYKTNVNREFKFK